MTDFQQHLRDFEKLTPKLEVLRRKDDAKLIYDILTGNLLWTDEIPLGSGVSLDGLRFVLRHRTGLLIGEDVPGYIPYWEEALARFPKWIGFSPDRVAYSPALRDFYLAEQAKVLADE
jgi:hypothetical protein